ncbi:MAG: PilZ domain-containing protein [Deltaproteobacteria bacterium]|nr:PilZ domain-containing protein [Deltaproteobacteria bacterium]
MSTETPQKIYLSESNTATFECPKCHASKNADVSKYKKMASAVTLKVKCPCGNVYSVTLERRKYYRKETKFPGKFAFNSLFGEDQKGPMTVLDISKGGLKFKVLSTPVFKNGDIIEVEFNLDNKNRTLIRKQVFVRNIKDNFVNAEFCSFDANDSGDKALGFYLY